MADNPIIPPVTSSMPLPRQRPVPVGKEQDKRQPDRQTPPKPKRPKDDGKPHIDEFA